MSGLVAHCLIRNPAELEVELRQLGVDLVLVDAPAEIPPGARLVFVSDLDLAVVRSIRARVSSAIMVAVVSGECQVSDLPVGIDEVLVLALPTAARRRRLELILRQQRHLAPPAADPDRPPLPPAVFRWDPAAGTTTWLAPPTWTAPPADWRELFEPCRREELGWRGPLPRRGRLVAPTARWGRVDFADDGSQLIGTIVDVTDEHSTVQRLAAVADDWRSAMDSVPIAILILDQAGRIVRLNDRGRAVIGGTFADLVGAPFAAIEAWQPWATARHLVDQLEAHGRVAPAYSDPDADGRVWEVAAEPLRAPTSRDGRIVVLARDVTEDLRVRRQLALDERMASVGRVVAGVAHEVRNPLFGISAIADALEARLRDAGPQLPHLAMLRAVVARLSRLMSDLLVLASTARLELAPVALEEVLEDARMACAALAAERSVAIEIDRALSPVVHGDRTQLVQLFQNLFDNALRHTPPGSRVEARVLETSAHQIRVAVRDHGPGFGADRVRALDPFFSRRKDGTGLGLAIVQQIAQRHRGEVTLRDAPDGGAVVEVALMTGLGR